MYFECIYWFKYKQIFKLKKIIKVNKIDDNLRLDKWLKLQYSALQQSYIEKNLRKKNILLNDHLTKSNYIILVGDKVTIKNFTNEKYLIFEKKKTTLIINNVHKNNFSFLISLQRYEMSCFHLHNQKKNYLPQKPRNLY